MIISRLTNQAPAPAVPAQANPGQIYPEIYRMAYTRTNSGPAVTEATSKRVATVYRCSNVISDDIAMMPLQVYRSYQGQISRVFPDAQLRNPAYLLERQPNRWMVPFIWKRTIVNWLIFWGNAYIWCPPGPYPELYILDADKTYPVLDKEGNKWYATTFPDNSDEHIPDVEMVHLMINSSNGLAGRSVLTYARDTVGRQLSAHETQDRVSGGLNPSAAIWVNGELSPEAREKVRRAYLDAVTGSANAGGAAVFDNKISKFEKITMSPADAQFLEGIQATDADIANFFNFPLHKVNMGKQSYESNEQQDLNYIKSTLNPFLIQWEQAGGLKWIAEIDQPFQYLRFNRDSILQTDTKTRSEVIKNRIQSGVMTPNQALQIEDMNGYPGGDAHYMPSNMGRILPDGSIETKAGAQPAQDRSQV
jgi:HK97 family phage portal protein